MNELSVYEAPTPALQTKHLEPTPAVFELPLPMFHGGGEYAPNPGVRRTASDRDREDHQFQQRSSNKH